MGSKEMVKLAANSAHELPEDCRNRFLKVALSVIQGSNQVRNKIVEKLSSDYNIPEEKVLEYLGFYLYVIRLFLSLNPNEFKLKLLELSVPEAFINDLPLLASNREKIVRTIANSRTIDQGKLEQFKWRIDISLQSSSLSKKIPTRVILCLHLKNGRKVTIDLDMKTFHKFRFNVAFILKHLLNAKESHMIK